jgi:hypothetical protein
LSFGIKWAPSRIAFFSSECDKWVFGRENIECNH